MSEKFEPKFNEGYEGVYYFIDADPEDEQRYNGCMVKVISLDKKDEDFPYEVEILSVPEGKDEIMIGDTLWCAEVNLTGESEEPGEDTTDGDDTEEPEATEEPGEDTTDGDDTEEPEAEPTP